MQESNYNGIHDSFCPGIYSGEYARREAVKT